MDGGGLLGDPSFGTDNGGAVFGLLISFVDDDAPGGGFFGFLFFPPG